MHKTIQLKGLRQNNLKNISLEIPKNQIVVFTGVSGSGKSSIVFDTIAAESQHQVNETYPAFIRGKLPKYERAKVDIIENLSPSVVVDQSRLGGNARSTVGTICDLYSILRVLYSRIGQPYVGTASFFSFNDPNGMCPECCGMGKVTTLKIEELIKEDKSLETGMLDEFPAHQTGQWYWRQYVGSKKFNNQKNWKDYTREEKDRLLYGDETLEGLKNHMERLLIKRDSSNVSKSQQKRLEKMMHQTICPKCLGKRLNAKALACKVEGYNISELCEMEFTKLREVLLRVQDERAKAIVENLITALDRMIDIGLPYLSLNREAKSLSGGEAQRLKLVRYMGSSLSDMLYIFDEPSTGLHPRDVYRMTKLLKSLRDKGNTVLVVEHDKDIIRIADQIVEIGPGAGADGGEVLFQGSYEELLQTNTPTGRAMRETVKIKENPRTSSKFLPIRNANIHNLKNVSVDIPLGVLTVVTGVAGSGKSSLIRDVFAKEYEEQVVLIDQSPIQARGHSTPATFLGFFDEIRKEMARENGVGEGLFSFNSTGACPICKGKGVVITELVFMDPVITTCEACEGSRYSREALSYTYKGKTIVEILNMTVKEAIFFFKELPKVTKKLKAMEEVGLSYMTLGQPLRTLSGGELQRLKLAKEIHKKGNIYVFDEPTTGLHGSDIKHIMKLLHQFVERGNTVIVIEHNVDVMRQADYIIDIGPDGGDNGGEVVYEGDVKGMREVKNITGEYIFCE